MVQSRISTAVTLMLALCAGAHGQLNQNCTVLVLNRTVTVNTDGTWVLPNVPANIGQVKARATCVQNGATTFGESAFFTVPVNGATNLPAITMGATTQIPVFLRISPSTPSLTSAGQTVQHYYGSGYNFHAGGGAGGAIRLSAPTIQGNGSISVAAVGQNIGGCVTGVTTAAQNGLARLEAFNQLFTGTISGGQAAGSPYNTLW